MDHNPSEQLCQLNKEWRGVCRGFESRHDYWWKKSTTECLSCGAKCNCSLIRAARQPLLDAIARIHAPLQVRYRHGIHLLDAWVCDVCPDEYDAEGQTIRHHREDQRCATVRALAPYRNQGDN